MHCKSSRNSEYFPDQSLMYERFRKEKIEEVRSKCYETRWEWECDGHDGYCCDACRHTIVTFQNGAWHARHAGCHCDISWCCKFATDTQQPLFLISCTGCSRTYRTANHSIRKHLLRQPKNTYDNYIICVRNRNKKCYQKIFWCFTLVN